MDNDKPKHGPEKAAALIPASPQNEQQNIAAHEQAEADIEADIELTDIATPFEDLDEAESIQQSGDKSDIV